ncbi:MAG TPA: cytochrome d ubiquinol oxidase subunit II, partial [Ignavibacteriales bacterium]|nr:cytochrome d ubiquinol oxidase subunit II [Ignavibacteriales bacterium]
ITTVALFMMHGAIYLVMKTEGDLHDKARSWVNNTIIFFVITYVTTTMATLIFVPHMIGHIKDNPVLFVVALLNMLAIANIPREIHHKNDVKAFLSSCAVILALFVLFAIGIFPNIVLSNPFPMNSLTVYNGASSQKTLGIMLIIAIIGIPFVLAYTVSIYWIFRGKVKLNKMSY